ncbi:MAG: hypothetical protein IPJ88_03720 [Myxococcales bacterium]|nr:MAG: hypothetical protein IPJ88_03720 [Myxococcales bacterium]
MSIVWIIKKKWYQLSLNPISPSTALCLAVILTDLVLSARIGAHFRGDAVMHITRIRMLHDTGFTNREPFIIFYEMISTYHTNIYHALLASITKMLSGNYLSTWYWSLLWAKILIVGAYYFASWTVFRNKKIAWLTTLFSLVSLAPTYFLNYPNQIGRHVFLTLTIAFFLQIWLREKSFAAVFKFACSLLVLCQIHALYAVYAALCLAPLLAIKLAYQIIKKTWYVCIFRCAG